MRVLGPHVDAIRTTYRQGIGGDPVLRAKLSVEVMAMRRALADTGTLAAAWADLIGICSREESAMNAVAAQRDNFWAVVRATDRNAVELSRQLSFVLTGDPFRALQARLELGEIDSIDGDIQSINRAPITDPKERLRLVAALLGSQPTSKAHVVWFAFRHAYLTSTVQRLGSVQLFEGRWLHANLVNNESQRDHIPEELSDLDNRESIPDRRDVVMARVELGMGAFSDAIREATERLDALVGMSTIGCAIPWERIHGFLHVEDGRIVAHQYFVYEDEKYESPRAFDGTANQISRVAPRVAPMIPVGDPNLKDIIDALSWWRVGLNQHTAAAIILNVRVIELIASRIGEKIRTKYLEKYMKNAWIRDTILNALCRPLWEALIRSIPIEAQAKQREIFLEATTYEHGQKFHVDKAARHLDAIIQFTPLSSPLGRDLRTIKHRTSNAASMQAWCAELERLWQGSVHRLERVRNSIAHGGPFTEQAVLITQPFSQKMSVSALRHSIEGFLAGKTLTQSQ